MTPRVRHQLISAAVTILGVLLLVSVASLAEAATVQADGELPAWLLVVVTGALLYVGGVYSHWIG